MNNRKSKDRQLNGIKGIGQTIFHKNTTLKTTDLTTRTRLLTG
jgi:hypothetical protein